MSNGTGNTSTDLEIKAQQLDLKNDLANKIEVQAFWENFMATDHAKDLIRNYQDTIQQARVSLEEAKPADIAKLQADIRTRKDLIMMLEAKKNMLPVVEARRRLAQFESDNALFVGAES